MLKRKVPSTFKRKFPLDTQERIYLVSTNVIESPHSGVRLRTREVCRLRDGKMVLRWAAAALLMTENNFRRIMGYRDLWMLKAASGRKQVSLQQEVA